MWDSNERKIIKLPIMPLLKSRKESFFLSIESPKFFSFLFPSRILGSSLFLLSLSSHHFSLISIICLDFSTIFLGSSYNIHKKVVGSTKFFHFSTILLGFFSFFFFFLMLVMSYFSSMVFCG